MVVGGWGGAGGGLHLLVSRDPEAFRSWKCRNQQGALTLGVSSLLPPETQSHLAVPGNGWQGEHAGPSPLKD